MLKNIIKKIQGNRILGLIIILLLMILVFSISRKNFFTYKNLINILFQSSITGIAAIGLSVTILGGGIDLSIGSILGITGILSSVIFEKTGNPFLTLIIFIPLGIIIGLLNGLIITKLGIIDVVVTFAMLFTLRGVTYLISNAHSVNWPFTSWLDGLGNFEIASFPLPVFIFLILFFIFNFLLRNSHFGREIYASGGNREAARVAGLATDRIKITTYVISGLLAAFAGIIMASWLGSGQPNAGVGIEFKVLAGILLGGILLSGGEGNLVGTLVGILFFNVFFNGLIFLDVSVYWQEVFTGLILLLVAGSESRRLLTK
jgi:ribose transport system permease protein